MEIRCPLCDSTNVRTCGLVRLASQVVAKAECLPCGERFYVDDEGFEVQAPEAVTE